MITITHSSIGLRSSLPESLHLEGAPERPTVAESAAGFNAAPGAGSWRRVRIEASVVLHTQKRCRLARN